MTKEQKVTGLRLVVKAPDYEEALHFYRDVLGLEEHAAFSSPGGHVTNLTAGRATLETTDPAQAEYTDEGEVGSWPVTKLTDAGARLVAYLLRHPGNSELTTQALVDNFSELPEGKRK